MKSIIAVIVFFPIVFLSVLLGLYFAASKWVISAVVNLADFIVDILLVPCYSWAVRKSGLPT